MVATTAAAFSPHHPRAPNKCSAKLHHGEKVESGFGNSARLDAGVPHRARRPPSVALEAGADDDVTSANNGPKVTISYCTGCRWLLRAAWLAQELLTTFQDDFGGVELIPSRPPSPGGIFIVTIDGQEIWNRSEVGRFPEAKELKQRIRDVIDPNRGLGHSDVKKDVPAGGIVEKCEDCPPVDEEVEEMDDNEAETARRHFGVA